jgi:hypothetical protein
LTKRSQGTAHLRHLVNAYTIFVLNFPEHLNVTIRRAEKWHLHPSLDSAPYAPPSPPRRIFQNLTPTHSHWLPDWFDQFKQGRRTVDGLVRGNSQIFPDSFINSLFGQCHGIVLRFDGVGIAGWPEFKSATIPFCVKGLDGLLILNELFVHLVPDESLENVPDPTYLSLVNTADHDG